MQTAIILGTHNSGSGLIHEYLSSREDFYSPLGHNEFRVGVDPGGVHYLFNEAYNNKGFFTTSYAVNNFFKYVNNLENSKEYKNNKTKVNLYNSNLLVEAHNFIKKVTKVHFYALPHYQRINLSVFDKIKIKINKKILNKNFPESKVGSILIFKDKKYFLSEANKFLNKIILSKNKDKNKKIKNVVLNNAGDILNPIETTQYYTNPKIITVTRDPRDIFASMKSRESLSTPWYNVDIFIDWYNACFKNNIFLKSKNKKILNLKFEKVIFNFNKENKKICKFLSIKENTKLNKMKYFNFNVQASKKNIGKFKKVLSSLEISKIEKNLKSFLNY